MSKDKIKKNLEKKNWNQFGLIFKTRNLIHETDYPIKGKPKKIKKQNSQLSKIKKQNK
jgi:hypothetical protein